MIKFRNAKVTDIDYMIKSFIKITDIAGVEEDIDIPVQRLKQDLFSDDPKAWAIIIEEDKQIVGVALYSTLYDVEVGQILHIDQAYIEESCRGKGVFLKLLNKLENIAKKRGLSYLGWLTWPDYEIGNKIYEHILNKKAEVYNHYYKQVK